MSRNVTSPEEDTPFAAKKGPTREGFLVWKSFSMHVLPLLCDSVLDSCHTARRTLDF